MSWDGQTCKKCGSPHTWNVVVNYGRWGDKVEWNCEDCYHKWEVRIPGTFKLIPSVQITEDGKVKVSWGKE